MTSESERKPRPHAACSSSASTERTLAPSATNIPIRPAHSLPGILEISPLQRPVRKPSNSPSPARTQPAPASASSSTTSLSHRNKHSSVKSVLIGRTWFKPVQFSKGELCSHSACLSKGLKKLALDIPERARLAVFVPLSLSLWTRPTSYPSGQRAKAAIAAKELSRC